MRLHSLSSLVILVGAASAAPRGTTLPMSVVEIAPQSLSGWEYLAPAEGDAVVRLSVALNQPGMAELRKRLDAVSNPRNENFGSHLSREQVMSYQEPHENAVEAVSAWLKGASISDFRREGSWIRFNTTIASANELLDTRFNKYRSQEDGTFILRAQSYSIPSSLTSSVNFIFPVTQFIGAPTRLAAEKVDYGSFGKRQDTLPGSCVGNKGVIPDCIKDLYSINYKPPNNSSGSTLGIAGFLEEYPSQDALNAFLAKYSPYRNTTGFVPEYNYTVELVNGGVLGSQVGVEATLDVEFSMPFIQPLPVTYFSTGGRGPELDENGEMLPVESRLNEPWVEFLTYLLDMENPPLVLSISYTDDEQSIPLAYAQRTCDMFAALTARGVSILIASGDGGTNGVRYGPCYSNDGNKTRMFKPTFPVDCPYVTAVGATGAYAPAGASTFSSGGFSNYFGRPSWQEPYAQGYIDGLNGTHKGWYNGSGRGIPDIAAGGSKYLIKVGEFEWTQSGTSAATPVVAAMIALVNDRRMREGKSSLGLLNPLLYSEEVANSGAFWDVTSGSNGGCSYGDQVELGFDAAKGWDPVTGLGTPVFDKLMEVLSGI